MEILLLSSLSKRQQRLVELAREAAIQGSDDRRYLHGALLYRNGRILSRSSNKPFATSRFGQRFRGFSELPLESIHAELGCILGQPRSLTSNSLIVVVRIHKATQELAYSKPCSMCDGSMRFVGVSRVLYSVDPHHVCLMKLK